MNDDERRQFQRFDLPEAIDGWFGDYAVELINVSGTGAYVRSNEPIPEDARALLRFFWRGTEIELLAEISRSDGHGAGLAFVDDPTMLRDLISDSTAELLRAQEANARGNREQNIYGDQTLTAASTREASTYVSWIFSDNGWTKRVSLVPDQPANGFTVGAGEAEEQVALLRRTYEGGDTESRRLTRIFAELSVATRPAQG